MDFEDRARTDLPFIGEDSQKSDCMHTKAHSKNKKKANTIDKSNQSLDVTASDKNESSLSPEKPR